MNNRRRLTGIVTSDKMQKTVVVEVSRTYRHRLYKKVVHSRRQYMAHDELGCKVGDEVRIVESKPISRLKRWAVEAILGHDEVVADTLLSDAAAIPAEAQTPAATPADTGLEA